MLLVRLEIAILDDAVGILEKKARVSVLPRGAKRLAVEFEIAADFTEHNDEKVMPAAAMLHIKIPPGKGLGVVIEDIVFVVEVAVEGRL